MSTGFVRNGKWPPLFFTALIFYVFFFFVRLKNLEGQVKYQNRSISPQVELFSDMSNENPKTKFPIVLEDLGIKLSNKEEEENSNRTLGETDENKLKVSSIENEKSNDITLSDNKTTFPTILKETFSNENTYQYTIRNEREGKGPILVLGVPTVERLNGKKNYLASTIDSLVKFLPLHPDDDDFGSVYILVMNADTNSTDRENVNDSKNRKSNDEISAFDKVQGLYPTSTFPLIKYFQNPYNYVDPFHNASETDKRQNYGGSPNKPGFIVRKQTRDLASLYIYGHYFILNNIISSENKLEVMDKKQDFKSSTGNMDTKLGSDAPIIDKAETGKKSFYSKARSEERNIYFSILEDDMTLCENSWRVISDLLRKANFYHPDFLALRASYGMNGAFLRAKDLLFFGNYLLKHQSRRPPDHLLVEWFAGEKPESENYKGSRPHVAFKYNLYSHIGTHSSLRLSKHKDAAWPKCYSLLQEPTIFRVESFRVKECPNDDIWPCKEILKPMKKIEIPRQK